MNKKISVLHLGEISPTAILLHLCKQWWVVLLFALASALTACSFVGVSYPEQYTQSITLSVRDTERTPEWRKQMDASCKAASTLAKQISEGSIKTDFTSDDTDKPQVTVNAAVQQMGVETPVLLNLVTVTATARSQEDVYHYLLALTEHTGELSERAHLTNVVIRAVNQPTLSEVAPTYTSDRVQVALSAAAVGGLIACVILIAVDLFRCCIATRRAAENRLILPVAGALNKGGKGKTIDAELPLPTSPTANGCYVRRLSEAATDLLGKCRCSRIQVVPLVSEKETDKELQSRYDRSVRIALNLALSMADKGARVCLIDRSGEALSALGIDRVSDKHMYSACAGKLTVSTADGVQIKDDEYDKIIVASPKPSESDGMHTLWVFPTDRYTADEVNKITVPGGGTPVSASLLLYRLYSTAETASSVEVCDEKDEQSVKVTEIDLFKWIAATLKVMWRNRYKWLIAFGLTTVVALAIGWGVNHSSYQMDTVFSFVTPDVVSVHTSDELASLDAEGAAKLLDKDMLIVFYGNALYPTKQSKDIEMLVPALMTIWNSQTMTDLIENNIGRSSLSAQMQVLSNENNTYTLSLSGNDREELENITAAFTDLLPSVSAQTAGGLRFYVNDAQPVPTGTSGRLAVIVAWLLLVMAYVAYAMIVSYKDSALYFAYEAERILGVRAVGKCELPKVHSPKKNKSGKSSANQKDVSAADDFDVKLASFIYDWASKQEDVCIMMITSSMREEGTAQLVQTVEALLKQNGKRVVIGDKEVSQKLMALPENACKELHDSLKAKCDVLLLDAPGMAIDEDAALLAVKADAVLWAVRSGNTDEMRVEAAAERLIQKEKAIGCVMLY